MVFLILFGPELMPPRIVARVAVAADAVQLDLGHFSSTSRQPAYRKLTGYESGSSLGPKAGYTRAGYAANRCTHDLLEPKTGSVASTEDASPPRWYPR